MGRRLNFEPNGYQRAILEWIRTGRGHAFVEAVAGSGKSSTLVMAAHAITGQGLFVAFNKSIATELGSRLDGTPMQASTIHSLGFRAVKGRYRGTRTNGAKYRRILRGLRDNPPRELTSQERQVIRDHGWPSLNRVADLCRASLTEDVEAIIDHHGLEIRPELYGLAHDVVLEALRIGLEMAPGEIDFTDMIWLPNKLGLSVATYPWVFVDEAQDLSAAQLGVVLKAVAPGGRVLAVGDRRQCQPPETLVTMGDGSRKRIADLRVGDHVMGYDRRSQAFMRSARVEQISARPYFGDLVVVSDGVRTTRCTGNHKWLVRWADKRQDLWCVYLMRSGTRFRVGMCQMFIGRGETCDFHLAQRARLEQADAVWILETFESQSEARVQEMLIAYSYGIPQSCFRAPAASYVLTDEVLERFWSCIGDLTIKAEHCLREYGRRIDHPLYSYDQRQRQGRTTLFETAACNLMDGLMAVPSAPKLRNIHESMIWTRVSVRRESYSGDVYSLDVAPHHKYVADGLVTCNSIYGFAGADCNSVQRIVDRLKAKVLPLSVCYRCPAEHLVLAREFCPQIEPRPGAPAGEVLTWGRPELTEKVQEGDLILCRRTSPLLKGAYECIGSGISAAVKGRDIGDGLIRLAKGIAEFGAFDAFPQLVERWRLEEIESLVKAGKDDEAKLEAVNDKADCLEVIHQAAKPQSLPELVTAIERLFATDRPSVLFSTIHRAKGLENDRVAILEPDLLRNPRGRRQWQIQQERNLFYVALTRAKQTLVWIE